MKKIIGYLFMFMLFAGFQVLLSSCASRQPVKMSKLMHDCHCWPPIVSNLQVVNITSYTATINFATDSSAGVHDPGWTIDPSGGTGQVYYGTSVTGSSNTLQVNGPLYPPTTGPLSLTHSITLPNLLANTKYYFTIVAYAFGNLGWYNKATTATGSPHGPIAELFEFTTAPDVTYKISGYVKESNATATAGVTMTLSGSASATTETTSTGYYEFANLAAGSYTVTPSKSKWTFTPANKSYTPLNSDKLTEDYVSVTCVLVKPNPYVYKSGGNIVFYGDGVVPSQTTIQIYTTSGELIKTLTETRSNEMLWNGKNEKGDSVLPGLYVYSYKSVKEKGTGHLTIIAK